MSYLVFCQGLTKGGHHLPSIVNLMPDLLVAQALVHVPQRGGAFRTHTGRTMTERAPRLAKQDGSCLYVFGLGLAGENAICRKQRTRKHQSWDDVTVN